MHKSIRVILGCLCVLAMLFTTVHYSPTVAATNGSNITLGKWSFDYMSCTSSQGLLIDNVYYNNVLYLASGYQTEIRWKDSGGAWNILYLTNANSCSEYITHTSSQYELVNWYYFNNYDTHGNTFVYEAAVFINDDGSGTPNLEVYQSVEITGTSSSYCYGYEAFWKMDWDIYQSSPNYIDHKVSGSWTLKSTDDTIDAKSSTEGVRYRMSSATHYAYATHNDVGYTSAISYIYWGAFDYNYEDLADFLGNKQSESINGVDIVGGFDMLGTTLSLSTAYYSYSDFWVA